VELDMSGDVCADLPQVLRDERGSGFGFVCIWRPGDRGESAREGVTVGDWLARPEHQSGEWLIDGGWGGPPGPVKVRWENGRWRNLGFPPWDQAR